MIRVQLAKQAGKRASAKQCAIEFSDSETGAVPLLFRCVPAGEIPDDIARTIAAKLSEGVRAGALQGFQWRVESHDAATHLVYG